MALLAEYVLTCFVCSQYNTLLMANVRLGSGESFESMLRRFGSNAEAIAYWANRIQRMLAERDPSARLWIWDDMVSPFHNGGVADYQVHYGGRPGRMAEATEREWIDKSVIMDVWWYSDDWLSQMWRATEYFGDKGYDVLGSPWLDAGNIVSWSEMLVDREHALGRRYQALRRGSQEEPRMKRPGRREATGPVSEPKRSATQNW